MNDSTHSMKDFCFDNYRNRLDNHRKNDRNHNHIENWIDYNNEKVHHNHNDENMSCSNEKVDHIHIELVIDCNNDRMNPSMRKHEDKSMNEGLEIQLSFVPMYLICKEMESVDIHPHRNCDVHR